MVVNGPIDDQLSFDAFCNILNRVERKPGELRRKKVKGAAEHELNRLFTVMRGKMKNRQGQLSGAEPDSLFGILRLLLPKLDTTRGAYGLKEKAMGQLIINVLGVSKTAPDARDLINYQVPKNTTASSDFAAAAYKFLRHRCPQDPDPSITIRTINAWLDGLASANANSKAEPEMQKKIMKKCLMSLTALQNKWLVRIIVKDMQLKLGQNAILNTFHTDAKDMYDANGSLEKIATDLVDPAKRANEIAVKLFSPFRPMLAERTSLETMAKDMKNVDTMYCEMKWDGERVQLHKSGDVYRYFSRNLFECSGPYGPDPSSGSLTPFIHDRFKPEVKNCILDGEMVIWNRDLEYIVQKGENYSLKSLKPGETLQPCFVVFDVILLNDEVLTNKPLKERYEVLFGQVFHKLEGRIHHTVLEEITTKDEVVDALNVAIEDKEEGIVLKLPDSKYIPAARSSGWYKFKPEYVDSLSDELDLIVIGGYYGKGNRQGLISKFLLGLAVSSQLGDKPTQFETVCRVGSGLSRDMRIKLSDKLKSIKQYGKAAPKSIVAKSEKAEIWFEPSESVVLQIKASEIVLSTEYAAGRTLRFPRITAWREDRAWWDCMTTREFEALNKRSGGKLVSQRVKYHQSDQESDTEADGDASSARTQRGTTKRRKAATQTQYTVAKQFRSVDPASVDKVSEAFGGKTFCIISGTEQKSKEELEKSVLAFGGECSQRAVEGKIYCVVAKDDSHPRLRIYMNGCYDVVKADWLVGSLKRGKLLPWGPLDVLATSAATQQRFKKEYDAYGDSYTLPATMESLKYSMERVEESGDRTPVSTVDMDQLESHKEWEWSDGSNSGLFRGGIVAYFHIHDDLPFFSPLPRLKAMFTFYGGQAATELHGGVSHVILDRRDAGKIQHFNLLNRGRRLKFRLVYSDWIEECMKEQNLIREEPYVAVQRVL